MNKGSYMTFKYPHSCGGQSPRPAILKEPKRDTLVCLCFTMFTFPFKSAVSTADCCSQHARSCTSAAQIYRWYQQTAVCNVSHFKFCTVYFIFIYLHSLESIWETLNLIILALITGDEGVSIQQILSTIYYLPKCSIILFEAC